MPATEAAQQLIATARIEAVRMQELAGTIPAGSEIRMPASSFAKIAETLAALAEVATAAEAAQTANEGVGEPGRGHWIPLGYYERVRSALMEARDALMETRNENDRLRRGGESTPNLGGLIAFGQTGSFRRA